MASMGYIFIAGDDILTSSLRCNSERLLNLPDTDRNVFSQTKYADILKDFTPMGDCVMRIVCTYRKLFKRLQLFQIR